MTTETGNNESGKDEAQPARQELLPLPALAAISLYLLVLSVVIVFGVVGRHYPPLFLALAAAFMAAYNLWIFASQHQLPALVQGLLNLVFFLYLVRPEVRERLR
jgi:hypothetical protein